MNWQKMGLEKQKIIHKAQQLLADLDSATL